MIDLDFVRGYFPPQMRENALFSKHILKEYLQAMILDFLSSTPYMRKMVFIGGTNLRLVSGIDRFSEDLDFDCKEMSKDEFMRMADDVMSFLQRSGFTVEAKDRENPKLSAFRRSIHFPQLLFDLKLTGHCDERFLIKVEAQDQGIVYTPTIAHVKVCGFFFPLPVPPDSVLCAMKLAALLARGKGRDFYDVMFLLGRTVPDFGFLKARCGIGSPEELKSAIRKMLETTDLNVKKCDFEHLLFDKRNADRILRFGEFIESI